VTNEGPATTEQIETAGKVTTDSVIDDATPPCFKTSTPVDFSWFEIEASKVSSNELRMGKPEIQAPKYLL
jgi:hypothetical protein